MPAKELSPEQREEAERLRAKFDAYQAHEREAGREWTQEALAAKLGFGQSALNQYLKGKIPLNADVVLAMAELLKLRPVDISPTIAQAQQEFSRRWSASAGTAPTTLPFRNLDAFESQLVTLFRRLSPDEQHEHLIQLNRLVDNEQVASSMSPFAGVNRRQHVEGHIPERRDRHPGAPWKATEAGEDQERQA